MSTGARVARSAFWRATEIGGTELISFGFFVLMTRLLAPEQFGAVALATAILTVAQSVIQQGLPDALVQREHLGEDERRSAFAASALLGLSLMIGCMLAAWPIGWLLGRPEFAPMLCAMAPLLLVHGLGAPLHAMRRRDFDFRTIAIRTLLGTAIGGAVAVALARSGAGAWALVAQQWTAALVGLVVLVSVSRERLWPMRLSRPALAPLMAIARPIMAGQLSVNAARRLDAVVLGLFLGNHEVGLYFLVSRLVASVSMLTQASFSEIGLAVLSRMQHDPVRHREAVRNALRYTAFACTVCYGMLAVAADTVVPLVFGDAWRDAALPLKILAVFASCSAIVNTSASILLSGAAARAAGSLAAASALLQLAAMALAARFGLEPLAWAIGLAQLLTTLPALAQVARRFEIAPATLARDLLPFVAAFVIAVAAEVTVASGATMGARIGAALAFVVIMAASGALLLRHDLALLRGGAAVPSPSEER